MRNLTPRAFEDGGLPESARARLRDAAEHPGAFSSTFTVPEMAVARVAGYEPLGLVMGSSIYQLGWSGFMGWAGGELTLMTESQHNARTLALGRMAEEAELLGAHAVIGVQLRMKGFDFAEDFIEFTAMGTAVRLADRAPPVEQPALTHLTAQELYKLELAGYWPKGIALGNCTWFDRHADCAADGRWFNQPLPDHNQAIRAARRLATKRFSDDIARQAADGAVGVKVERSFHEREYDVNDSSHTEFRVEVLLLGTSVIRAGAARLPRPRLILDLGRGRTVDLQIAAEQAGQVEPGSGQGQGPRKELIRK